MEKRSLNDLIKEHNKKSDLFWENKAPLTESTSDAIQEFAENQNSTLEKFLDKKNKKLWHEKN